MRGFSIGCVSSGLILAGIGVLVGSARLTGIMLISAGIFFTILQNTKKK